MPVSSVERPVSALRQRMLEDMAMRGLRSDTQRDYFALCAASQRSCGSSPMHKALRRLSDGLTLDDCMP